ncbi:MAG: hypothetical protein VB997_05810 [Opitutales bacterium]
MKVKIILAVGFPGLPFRPVRTSTTFPGLSGVGALLAAEPQSIRKVAGKPLRHTFN